MADIGNTLERLTAIIRERRKADPDTSYVAKMHAKGRLKMAQKVGEEAVEVALAAVAESKEDVAEEAADLLFHLMMLLHDCKVSPGDVAKVLDGRHGISGIDEKKSRKDK